jgi:hypothetical protein
MSMDIMLNNLLERINKADDDRDFRFMALQDLFTELRAG